MALQYKTKTWQKKIDKHNDFIKSYEKMQYNNDYHYYNIESIMGNFFSNSNQDKDLLRDWKMAHVLFDIAADMYQLENKGIEVICNTYLSIKAFTKMYKLYCEGIVSDLIPEWQIKHSYEEFACKIISINAVNEFMHIYEDSILLNLFCGNINKVKNGLEKLQPPSFIEPDSINYYQYIYSLKPAINSLVCGNEKEFKKNIELMLKKRRLGGTDFSVTIDYYSVALLKCAIKYGVIADIKTIEMPPMMFENVDYKNELFHLPIPNKLIDYIIDNTKN